jgi:Flp pilus assembly protein TadG
MENHAMASERRAKKGRAGLWRSTVASQLIEFSVVLPLLAVMVVGVSDFAAGFALKDKLANAARDGARILVSLPNDTDNPQCGTTPCSVEEAAGDIVNYLSSAHVNTCGLAPWSSAPAAGPGAFTWTYTSGTTGCAAAWSIKIERAVPVVSGGVTLLCTLVTLSYPFAWNFGHIIKLLAPSPGYPAVLTLASVETMKNQN